MKLTSELEAVGSLIAGRYRVLQLLGRGGMGAVYEVTDERTSTKLAIKRCDTRDGRKLQRHAALLEREYHTLAQLAHPRIIEVYDYGVDAHGPYYTMELLEGPGLEDAPRLPWREVCAVLHDVGSSLAILHSRGVVHRDVSSRNVRYASGGHVKLLDFGAMMSMGVAKDIVGTPPFMAPEVLQLQALDARVDLFSLGALGYRLLTGRHAYPARRVAELRDAWRSRPQLSAASAPEVPPELSALILRLLTLDRGGRPQNVPEVISRLSALADLPQEDSAQISRAYLTTPTLVGRAAALVEVRRRMLALVRGDGGVLMVRGDAGAGRSRLLDACALEAKLLGAAVVRADARDAVSGEWGVAHALGQQLIELFPEQAQAAARLSRNVLGQLFEELRGGEGQTVTGYVYERSLLVRDLRDWVLAIGKQQRLLLIVDDADRIDDASIAFLSALAHRADRHPTLVAVSVERSSTEVLAAPLRLMQGVGHVVSVEELSAADTEALIRSVFGDVPNLPLCAARIHGLSHGNPRAAMDLAQHLVDTGRARYERGGWTLPRALDERDLPATLSASLAARLAALSPDAQELAHALALADEDALPLDVFPKLTEHGDARRVFHALDELVAARILTSDAERFAFAQRGFLAVLENTHSPEHSADVHLRIARLLADRAGEVPRRAHHLLAAGLEDDAIGMLCGLDLTAVFLPMPLLRGAIAAAERLQLPATTLYRLRLALLINAPSMMASEDFRAVAPLVVRQLERESGLAYYGELGHLPEPERLPQALAQAQQAYLATPERERVHTAFEAIRELARLSGSIPGMAAPIFDLELLEGLPKLDPLFALSPTLRVVSQIVVASGEWIRGRPQRSRAIYDQVLERIAEPDRAGLDDAQHDRTRTAITYTIGLHDAFLGIESAEKHARVLEGNPALRVNAWRIRAFLQLAIGNVHEAKKCFRRTELLQAQDGLKERYAGSTAGMELMLYARLGDLLGVTSSLDAVVKMAALHRGWGPVELVGRSCYAELQGDLPGALELCMRGLERLPPLRHPFFSTLAAVHVRLLFLLDRAPEAAQKGTEYLAFCRENDVPTPDLSLFAALALAKHGDFEAGLRELSALIAATEQHQRVGLFAGSVYEARARIALWMRDKASFEQFAQLCKGQYERAKNDALLMRLTGLFDEAREAGLLPNEQIVTLMDSLPSTAPESEYDTLHSRLLECSDRADRARCALTLLLEGTYSSTGYLYALNGGEELTLLAALPDLPGDAGIATWVAAYARAWLVPAQVTGDMVTGDMTPFVTASVTHSDTDDIDESLGAQRYLDSEGRSFAGALLFDERGDKRTLVAVFVQQVSAQAHLIPPRAVCEVIARELVEAGDAAGWA